MTAVSPAVPEARTPDIETEYAQVTRRGSADTVVVFTGLSSRSAAIPQLELARTLESLGVNSVLLRDVNRSWYHSSIDGFGTDFPSKIGRISELVDYCGGQRVHFVGTSAGGFAAIYYATMMDVDSVLTMGGQATIRREKRVAFHDARWVNLLKDVFPIADGEYLDVTDAERIRSARPVLALSGANEKVDSVQSIYASRKFGAEQYAAYSVLGAGHAVAPELKRESKLFPLLQAQFVDHSTPDQIAEMLNGISGRHRLMEL